MSDGWNSNPGEANRHNQYAIRSIPSVVCAAIPKYEQVMPKHVEALNP
jgi:hypothetical protein